MTHIVGSLKLVTKVPYTITERCFTLFVHQGKKEESWKEKESPEHFCLRLYLETQMRSKAYSSEAIPSLMKDLSSTKVVQL